MPRSTRPHRSLTAPRRRSGGLRPGGLAPAWPAALVALAFVAGGCSAKMPDDVGAGALAPCPGTPNCVSSSMSPASPHSVEPFEISGSPDRAWAELILELEGWKRLDLVTVSEGSIHAVVRSALFRFEDDLELRLDATGTRIDVRSASRLGRSDLGVNRRRVEQLREALIERGVVAPTREREPGGA